MQGTKAAIGVSFKKAVLKNFAIFTGKQLFWNPFFQLYQKETPTEVFSCEYCEIFKNTYFEEHLLTADSEGMKLIYGTVSYLLYFLLKNRGF